MYFIAKMKTIVPQSEHFCVHSHYLNRGCFALVARHEVKRKERLYNLGKDTYVKSNTRRGSALRGLIARNSPSDAQQITTVDAPPTTPLVYDGIIFDMDGTLSVSCIDYKLMRSTIGIPVGDLFTVMETWTSGQKIKASMDSILEIEAVAAAQSKGMPGLIELLDFLRQSPVRVGLVTRNTTYSVDAFFAAIGEEYRSAFDIILTREHKHVKPDKRCLLYFAEAWGIPEYRLLMVGDSTEDIETGNAAGTASVLIAGGGNELVQGETPPPPPGAVPTLTVENLNDLLDRLKRRDTGLGWGAYSNGSATLSSSCDEDDDIPNPSLSSLDLDSTIPGAPPPGLEFLDWLFESGSVKAAACSFPRIDGSRFGVPPDEHPSPTKVLHLQCGNGGLTKLLFSSGLLVIGADREVQAATKRGLLAATVETLRRPGSLIEASSLVGSFDTAVLLGENNIMDVDSTSLEAQVRDPAALKEVARVLRPGGKLSFEVEVSSDYEDGIREKLAKSYLDPAGFKLIELDVVRRSLLTGSDRIRFIAVKV